MIIHNSAPTNTKPSSKPTPKRKRKRKPFYAVTGQRTKQGKPSAPAVTETKDAFDIFKIDSEYPSRRGKFENDSEDEEIQVQAPALPDPPWRNQGNTVQTLPGAGFYRLDLREVPKMESHKFEEQSNWGVINPIKVEVSPAAKTEEVSPIVLPQSLSV